MGEARTVGITYYYQFRNWVSSGWVGGCTAAAAGLRVTSGSALGSQQWLISGDWEGGCTSVAWAKLLAPSGLLVTSGVSGEVAQWLSGLRQEQVPNKTYHT